MQNINTNAHSNNVAFKGMSSKSLKRFIPEISDDICHITSKALNEELPNDVLIFTKGNKIAHFNDGDLVGIIKYTGSDNQKNKLSFLKFLAQKLNSGTLYQ